MRILTIAASLAFLMSGPAFAQYLNSNTPNPLSQFSSAAGKPAAAVSQPKLAFTFIQDILKQAGNAKTFTGASAHANAHMSVLKGGVIGEPAHKAIMFLGLLGTGDSPLVGNADKIRAIYSAIYSYYFKGTRPQTYISAPGTKVPQETKASDKDKQQAVIAIGLIANANYSIPLPYTADKTIGSDALSFLYKVIVDEKESFATRRAAVIAMSSIQNSSAAEMLSKCVTALNKKTKNIADKNFVFDKRTLSDKGTGNEALVTALMIGLDSELDGAGKDKALNLLKFYAGIRSAEQLKYTNYNALSAHTNYTSNGGNTATYLASLYLLASRRYIPSKIEHPTPQAYVEKMPQSQKIIKVIENWGHPIFSEYECYTRRAFQEEYNIYSGWGQGLIYETGKPPFGPYSFDNCMQQKTEKMTFELIKFFVLGGLESKAISVSIKVGARCLAGYAKAQKAFTVAANIYVNYSSMKDYYDEIGKIAKIANE